MQCFGKYPFGKDVLGEMLAIQLYLQDGIVVIKLFKGWLSQYIEVSGVVYYQGYIIGQTIELLGYTTYQQHYRELEGDNVNTCIMLADKTNV